MLYKASENWSLGFEAYGTFDRIGDSGMPGEERATFGDHDQHRAGPIVYYSFEMGGAENGADGDEEEGEGEGEGRKLETTLGVGLFFGLNKNTADHTLKWSVEIEY